MGKRLSGGSLMTTDPVSQWARRIATLRAQATKRARVEPADDLTESTLATCESLLRDLAGAHLECERLRAEIRTSNDAWERLFDVVPMACLLTDGAGAILDANRPAAGLCNMSAKHLRDRKLLVFSEDREAFTALLARLARKGTNYARLTLRPRERRPAEMDVLVVSASEERGDLWLWFLAPVERRMASQAVPASLVGLAHDRAS
jgi:PAS domain-containing protein